MLAGLKVNKITVTYGTETGNSKSIATEFAIKARKKGIIVKLVSLDQYRLNDLEKEEYFFTVVSTHGDGEPPSAAKKFYDHIHNNGFRLDKLKYSVFALGDTSYPLFCKTGEDIDEQLSKLNGQRLLPLNKSDIEFDKEAHEWTENILHLLSTSSGSTVAVSKPNQVPTKSITRATYIGELLSIIHLNDVGSHKKTYHLELKADDTGYEPGDSIGIVPQNPVGLVNQVAQFSNIAHDTEITYRNERNTFYNLLQSKINIGYLTQATVQKYAGLVRVNILPGKYELIDLLNRYPIPASRFEDLIGILNPIPPRLYTVASSPIAHDGEVHLTVEVDEFLIDGVLKSGVCSRYLADKKEGDTIKFFIQKNKRFRLPADDVPIIMIGPGTGIAAFRSFLYEREARSAEGKNWLFFGEQNFTTDFLYQTEIQNWQSAGLLTRVNVAFSHDQEERIYVHNKMTEHGQELYNWLEQGAYLFVCGQKDPMSILVEQTLINIIIDYGNKTEKEAGEYLEQLKTAGRYSVDVY